MLLPEVTLSAPSWGAGPAPTFQPAVYQLSLLPVGQHPAPALCLALLQESLHAGDRRAVRSKAQRSLAVLASRPASFLPSAPLGPFPAPRILWLLSPHMICALERLRSLCCPQSGVFRQVGCHQPVLFMSRFSSVKNEPSSAQPGGAWL